MTNRSRRRFLTSALATASLGILAGCSDILDSTETNAPEMSSKTPDSKTAVTETIATTVQTVTDTAKTTNDESLGEGTTGVSSQKTQQDKTTIPGASSTSSSQETNQKTSPKSTKEATAAKVPVEKPTTTSDETISVENALDWFIKSLRSEGVNASAATTWRDLAKIIHTTDQTTLMGKLAGEIGTVAGHWARFTTKVESPPTELRVTLKDESGESIGGYSVMTKDAEAVMEGFMTTDEFSRRIVPTIRFSPDIPTTVTTWVPSTTRTTTSVSPKTTTTPPQTTRDRWTTTTKSRSTTTAYSTTSSPSTTTTQTSKSTSTTERQVYTTESSR